MERALYDFEPFEPWDLHHPGNLLDQASVGENISKANLYTLQNDHNTPGFVVAKDVTLLAWNWDLSGKTRSYKFFMISRNNDLLHEYPDSAACWLKYFPIFSETDDRSTSNITLKLDLTQAAYIETPANLTYACGTLHFGHWIGDSLFKYLICDAGIPILTTKLFPYQIDALSFLQDPKKDSKVLLPVDLGDKRLLISKVSRIRVPINFSIHFRTKIIRNAISKALQSTNLEPLGERQQIKKSKVYLVRGVINGKSRTANESDVIERCKEREISCVDSSKLSFKDAAFAYRNFHEFFCTYGSSNLNFNIFSNDYAHLNYVFPENFRRYSDEKMSAGGFYPLPLISRTKVYFANQVDPDSDDPLTSIQFPLSIL